MHRLRKYLGAYLLQLADLTDVAIIFSGGIGENSPLVRGTALQGLEVRTDGTPTDCGASLISCEFMSWNSRFLYTHMQLEGHLVWQEAFLLSTTDMVLVLEDISLCLWCSGGASTLTMKRTARLLAFMRTSAPRGHG